MFGSWIHGHGKGKWILSTVWKRMEFCWKGKQFPRRRKMGRKTLPPTDRRKVMFLQWMHIDLTWLPLLNCGLKQTNCRNLFFFFFNIQRAPLSLYPLSLSSPYDSLSSCCCSVIVTQHNNQAADQIRISKEVYLSIYQLIDQSIPSIKSQNQ